MWLSDLSGFLKVNIQGGRRIKGKDKQECSVDHDWAGLWVLANSLYCSLQGYRYLKTSTIKIKKNNEIQSASMCVNTSTSLTVTLGRWILFQWCPPLGMSWVSPVAGISALHFGTPEQPRPAEEVKGSRTPLKTPAASQQLPWDLTFSSKQAHLPEHARSRAPPSQEHTALASSCPEPACFQSHLTLH